jgi:uncharacterized spore protein YtfJ
MNVTETLAALAERLQATGVRTVFGEPVSAEGRTIIPVARVAYGFGGGGGLAGTRPDRPADVASEGAGGGGGAVAVPAGVVEITREQTRFLRFHDWRPLAVAATIGFSAGVVLAKWAGRPGRRSASRSEPAAG